ncbi:MAG: NAD(P)H-dependent oxidoreductase [Alphaproteobacteria bacterium]|jgi:predicted homoserine dehydrogenase-like protein
MNLFRLLAARADADNPLRVGIIGAGKFGSMFLSQAHRTRGMQVMGVADLNVEGAKRALDSVNWPAEQYAAKSFDEARASGTCHVTDDSMAMIAAPGMEVIIDATGSPSVGIRHALEAFRLGRHMVMVNVEADVLAGPLLAKKAAEAGVVYSLAYGDQPALICEQVDWARAVGLEVIGAGKGTRYQPRFHQSTPETVWDHYGISAADAKAARLNAQMFNSFLDGTKSGIEMAAVANATGLSAPKDGLKFPAVGHDSLAQHLIPQEDGGMLEGRGYVEVVASETRDGANITDNLRWGVYVTFDGETDYMKECFSQYGLITDAGGRYSALWRPYHLIGLELGISVASAGLRGEPTGCPDGFRADVVATTKFAMRAGEELDGEGGYKVWGKLMQAEDSLRMGGLPIGLAHGVTLKRDIAQGQPVCWDDVTFNAEDPTVAFRREMERTFSAG